MQAHYLVESRHSRRQSLISAPSFSGPPYMKILVLTDRIDERIARWVLVWVSVWV